MVIEVVIELRSLDPIAGLQVFLNSWNISAKLISIKSK